MSLSMLEIRRILSPQKDVSLSDDFRILDTWAEYDESPGKSINERPLQYLCYELETVDPETGRQYHYYKALKFVRVIRLPKGAKQSLALMDMQSQVLSAMYSEQTNFVTLIANIREPVALGLLFLYGVQGVGASVEEAKNKAHAAFISMTATLQGTYRVLEMRILNAQETEWLREKMYSMEYMTVVRGIPKANQGGEDAGNKGMGGKNLNPESQGTLEEIITGMTDYEYVIQILSTPVFQSTLKDWTAALRREMTTWQGQLQGSRGFSFNLSIPMMYAANQGTSEGWNKGYTSAESVNYSQGESFNTSFGENVGQALSESYGQSFGKAYGQSFSESISSTHTVSQGLSVGRSFGQSIGTSESVSFGQNQSQSVGQSFGQSFGQNIGHSSGQSVGQSFGTSQGQSYGQSLGQSVNQSMGTSQNQSIGQNVGQSFGQNISHSQNQSVGQSFGQSFGQNVGQSFGQSMGQSIGQSVNQGSGQSFGQNFGQSIGQSQNYGHNIGSSQNVSHGVSQNQSFGQSANESMGFSQGGSYSVGQGTSQNMSQGVGYNQGGSASLSRGLNQGVSHSAGQSASQSLGESAGWSIGQNSGMSRSINAGVSTNYNEGLSAGSSQSASHGRSSGQSNGENYGANASLFKVIGGSAGISSGTSSNISSSASSSANQGSSVGYSEGANASHGASSSWGMSEGKSGSVSNSQSLGISTSQGASSGLSSSMSKGQSWGASESFSSGFGRSLSESWGVNQSSSQSMSIGQSMSKGMGESFSRGQGTSQGFSQGFGRTQGESYGQSYGQSVNQSFGQNIGQNYGESMTRSLGQSFGQNIGQSTSQGIGQSYGQSTGQSFGQSKSMGFGQSQSTGFGQSVGQSFGQNVGTSMGQNIGKNVGVSYGQSIGQNFGRSLGQSVGFSVGRSQGVSRSQSETQSYTVSQSESFSTSHGFTKGQSYTESLGESASKGHTDSYGQSKSIGKGQSMSAGRGTSKSLSDGYSMGMSTGSSASMGIAPSIGYNKSYQWLDQEVKDLLAMMDFQNQRYKNALQGEGAFYTYVYIACPSLDALAAAKALAKSTWQNEFAMVEPVQVLNLTDDEQRYLLHHCASFSSDVSTRMLGGMKVYKYCTVLTPKEFTAYTHPPRVSEGGLYTEVGDVPKFSVPSMMKGEIFMGMVLSAERYSMKDGYRTPFRYCLDEAELMHSFVTGASRSGKTVAAMRFVAELAQVRRKRTGKRLRIVCMDPKQDWRSLARFVEPERFRFHSMGNTMFRPIKINPLKIPRGVNPQFWIDGIIDIYCRAYGLLERGKQMMGETIYQLYEEAGIFGYTPRQRDSLNSKYILEYYKTHGYKAKDEVPDEIQAAARTYASERIEKENKDILSNHAPEMVSEMSSKVTFTEVYNRMNQIKLSMEGGTDANGNPLKSNRGKSGNDTRDAYARLLDRLQAFNREFSVEHQLYGTSEGIGIDELIGDDDVTVLESKGLENTFRNFIFGVIASGFYKYAIAHEGGYLADNQYETLLVIEEANEVLTGNDAAGTGGGASFGMTGQSEFEQMLDQAAGYGLFIMAITQKIADMPKSIIANTGLIFAGRLKTPDDITVVVRAIAREDKFEDRELVKWFPRSPTGWFVCQSSRTFDFKDAEPVLVQIAPLNIKAPTNAEIDAMLRTRAISEELVYDQGGVVQ